MVKCRSNILTEINFNIHLILKYKYQFIKANEIYFSHYRIRKANKFKIGMLIINIK